MKRKLLILSFILVSTLTFSQKDSIRNYLNGLGEITFKNYETIYVETIVKKDSVWEVKKYNRGGNILNMGIFKYENKTTPIGLHRKFFKNGVQIEEISYNDNSEKEGVYKKWFYDGKPDCLGYYDNGNMVGVWKYYHRNGKIGCSQYYQDGILIKTLLFDENGQKIVNQEPIVFKEAEYKKGTKSFKKKMMGIHEFVDYHINGYIYLEFIVDENGSIIDVANITGELPSNLLREFRAYLEKGEDWFPAISMNRKVPSYYIYNLDFRVN